MIKQFLSGGILVFLAAFPTKAQNQEAQIAVYNLGFSSLSAATGAVINMPKGSDWKKYFLKGLLQGAVGGALSYSGKRSLYLINRNENLGYAVPARLIHFAGLSIIESAAQNKPFLNDWHLNYGPLRFDLSLSGKRALRVRFLPQGIFAAYSASKVGNFDLPVTLATGNLAFSTESQAIIHNGDRFDAISYGRAFAYINNNTPQKYELIAHELVHNFQYDEAMIYNSWLLPVGKKVGKSLYKVFHKYIYVDIPYFDTMYGFEYYTSNSYNGRYFEFEAYRISTSRFVER